MILIDAVFINNGGGKVLLDYLISEIEKTDLLVFYLLDNRVNTEFFNVKSSNKIARCKGIYDRHIFYKTTGKNFSSVLCFGNLPPTSKTNADVYTYFHNSIYLKIPSDFTLIQKMLYNLKRLILKNNIKNTTQFIVQSQFIKDSFIRKFNTEDSKVLILPFYPPFPELEPVVRNKNSYIYISNGTPNKNYINLINAFCSFYDVHKDGTLTVTIDIQYEKIFKLIEDRVAKNYPINNIGFVDRTKLKAFYLQSEYLIFPSFAESFGLGIVEGIENGCKVIGADLPYLHEVCKPSLTFNPYQESSIFDAICYSYLNSLEKSESLVKNNIVELINLIDCENKK